MSLIVIALTGRAGSGKSVVAERLVTEWGAVRAPFAAPLKRMLRLFLEDQGVGLAAAHRMTDGDLKETASEYLGGETPRRAMQTLGTEWGRGLSPTLWIDAWRRSVEDRVFKASVDGETVVIVADDVRFPNEVAAVRALGGLVVWIDRPGERLCADAAAHASETSDLGRPDHVIINDGGLDWLAAQADAVASNMMN